MRGWLYQILFQSVLSGGDNGEAVHTFRFIEFAELHDFFFRQKIVDFTVGMMMCGLGTVFTVFRAASASSVDDGTKIHLITDARFADLVLLLYKDRQDRR